MRIFDVFSWLPAKEISIAEIEKILIDDREGITNSIYSVGYDIQDNVDANILNCINELLTEGKSVACVKKENTIIAVVGYKEG